MKFAAVFNADLHESTEVVWTASMRFHLLEQLRGRMQDLTRWVSGDAEVRVHVFLYPPGSSFVRRDVLRTLRCAAHGLWRSLRRRFLVPPCCPACPHRSLTVAVAPPWSPPRGDQVAVVMARYAFPASRAFPKPQTSGTQTWSWNHTWLACTCAFLRRAHRYDGPDTECVGSLENLMVCSRADLPSQRRGSTPPARSAG